MLDGFRFIRPDWYVPVVSDSVRHPVLDLQTAQVVSGKDIPADSLIRQLDRSIVIPGLVNAHLHLDLSGFSAPLGEKGLPFYRWLSSMILHRQNQAKSPDKSTSDPIQSGLVESIQFGVAVLGNISGRPWSLSSSNHDSIAVTDFLEQLGTIPGDCDQRAYDLKSWLEEQSNQERIGISPHAPYSMDRRLLAATIELARNNNLPAAMHLAESPEERELLDSRTGLLVDVLRHAGVWSDRTEFPSIKDCLQLLSQCERSLVIHGNFLTDDELDFIARNRDRMTLVWCPRTHAWFGHDHWPHSEASQRGIQIALGTDSRASNPDLDLLAEMQFVAANYPKISPKEILEMGTIAGWQALGLASSVDPVKLPPALTVLEYDRAIADNPQASVLTEKASKRSVIWTRKG